MKKLIVLKGGRVDTCFRLFLLLAMIVISAVWSSPAQTAPIVSRFVNNEPWTMADCMARSRWALESEGYSVDWTGGDAHRGQKAPYTALILCEPAPDGTTRVNVIIATTSGDLDTENSRLWSRLRSSRSSGNTGGCMPFDGVWTTNYSPITFRRIGNQVSGTYEYQGASSLSGTVSGNVLEGQYSQPNYPNPLYQRGRFRLVLSTDGQSFTGAWWTLTGRGAAPGTGNVKGPPEPAQAASVPIRAPR